MKWFSLSRSIPALAASALLSIPASSMADHGKVTVYRDRDGDGHYNKKSYDVGHHDYHGGYYGGGYRGGYYGRGYYGGGHYYNRGYYGRPYGYGYGYRPYYYGYSAPYYYGPSVGVSLYSEPTYYSESRIYRGIPGESLSESDNLAADVQRALKRRGYYNGTVDGDIGPASRSAIRAYQADRGLSVTGRIDRSLLNSLGVD